MKSYRVVAVMRDGFPSTHSFSPGPDAFEKATAKYESWKLDPRAMFAGLWEEDGENPLESFYG